MSQDAGRPPIATDASATRSAAAGTAVVTKRMSLSEGEFRTSVAALLPDASAWTGVGPILLPVGSGHVALSYDGRPSLRLGGLLELPQADVSLTFDGVSPDERAAFERRFWVAFQRGGG